uniref:Pentatricopeptide repeat-containing protein At1g31920 n=1 Tax=Anthurium amnicola TaxID=1678845 RepID=A0A1D1YE23_9ARAE
MRGFGRALSPLSASASLLQPVRRCASTPPLVSSDTAAAAQPAPPPPPRPLKLWARLTPEEMEQVNRLVPRLCNSNHLPEAVRLLDACLLTHQPALESLPIPALVRRLCCSDEPDMTHSMALLTALLHNPRCSAANVSAICSMLVHSYLDHRRPREALKVFDWMRRPNSPCPLEPSVYRAVVQGLCRHGKTLEALRVLRQMVDGCGFEVVVASDVTACVHSSLLREARIRDAQELDRAFAGAGEEEPMEVLDRIIHNWQD